MLLGCDGAALIWSHIRMEFADMEGLAVVNIRRERASNSQPGIAVN